MLSERDILNITARIVSGYGPIAVASFGSYATGRAKYSSDLDLVVIKQTPLISTARRRAVRHLLFGKIHPMDIHVFTPKEFEETAREMLSFTWVISRQAHLHYSSPQARLQVPSLFFCQEQANSAPNSAG